MSRQVATAGTIVTLECYGGPLSGQRASVFGGARFVWLAGSHTISNTEGVEYRDIQAADGVYVRMTRKVGRSADEEILYWRPVPGATPKEH